VVLYYVGISLAGLYRLSSGHSDHDHDHGHDHDHDKVNAN